MLQMRRIDMPVSNEAGLLNGQARYVHPNGTIFDGMWKNGVPHGEMTVICPDGTQLNGTYSHGLLCGHMILKQADGFYLEGDCSNGKLNGQGSARWPDGCTYENGKTVGQGEKHYPDGSVYKGALNTKGVPFGEGVLTLPDGTCQAGRFEKDCYTGPEQESSSQEET